MRIRTFIGLLFVLTTGLPMAFAQEPGRFGFKLGYNASILSASVNTVSSWKGGLCFGTYIDFKTRKGLHVQPEINFSSQGQNNDYGPSGGKTTLTLNYLNIPLMFKVGMGKAMNFQLGPQIGILLTAREKGTIDGQPVNNNLGSTFKSDFSAVAGFGYVVNNHLNFGLRFAYGITNIHINQPYPATPYPPVANRVFSFFVGYTFSASKIQD